MSAVLLAVPFALFSCWLAREWCKARGDGRLSLELLHGLRRQGNLTNTKLMAIEDAVAALSPHRCELGRESIANAQNAVEAAKCEQETGEHKAKRGAGGRFVKRI